jgi:hypothetical protein
MKMKKLRGFGILTMMIMTLGVAGAKDKVAPSARIVELTGEAWINGALVKVNAEASPGDEIKTAKDASAVVKFKDGSALLMRGETTIKLPEIEKSGNLELLVGALLAVFSHDGPHEVRTPTSVAGVRGTGLYAKIEDAGVNYFCTCFGTVEYVSNSDGSVKQTVSADHHHGIRVKPGQDKPEIVPAGMEDHTDEEVDRLKAVVEKPFEGPKKDK